MCRLISSLLLASLAALTAAQAAAQTSGEALMREANHLFRSKAYGAALERYHEAEKAGLSSPLLDYNIGLTCYRLGKYDDAVMYLERAYRDDGLASLAAYNLGLAERASGHPDQAARWFDVAATRATGTPLEKLARQSLAQPQSGIALAANSPPRHKGLEPQRPVGELNVVVRTGYGNDSNPNRAPSEPYVDLAAPGTPTVVPEAVPSTYSPLQATVQYTLHDASGNTDFVFGYDIDADYYSEYYANDENSQRVRLGANMLLGDTGTRRRFLETQLFAVKHYQRNYDPDNGVDRTLGDEEIWQQYNYSAAGLQADFQHKLGKWGWGFNTLLEHRTYDTVPLIASYDTDLYLFKLRASYTFSDSTSMRAALHSYRREAAERQSRDIDGTLLSTYPPLDYSYQGVELGVTQRVLRWMSLDFSYMRLDRTDGFQGYMSYSQDIIGARVVMRPSKRWTISAGLTQRSYDYPNAYAFNDPAAGPKTLDDSIADLAVNFDVMKSLSVSVDLASTDVTSSDPRAAYSRQRSLVGAVWRF
jgi:tetratricopeptide (TPR) repeat protein